MSVVAAVAYAGLASAVKWKQFHFGGRLVPAEFVPALLPAFRRWNSYVQPILANGNLVGLWVSSLMTDRKWRRLRAVAEHLLVPASEAVPHESPAGEGNADAYILSLAKHGLHIPRKYVEHTRQVLAQLGDIEIQCEDEDLNGVALIIPRGVSLAKVLGALELGVDSIEPAAPSTKKAMLSSLRDEIGQIDPTLRTNHR